MNTTDMKKFEIFADVKGSSQGRVVVFCDERLLAAWVDQVLHLYNPDKITEHIISNWYEVVEFVYQEGIY
jgi:hypothetical protein